MADASLGAAPQVTPTPADFAILEHQTGTAGVTQTSRALVSDILALGAGSGGGGGASATLDAVIRAEPSLIHYWPMGDALVPGNNAALADAVGGVTLSPTGQVTLSAPPLIPGTINSTLLTGNSNSFVPLPTEAQPPLGGPVTVEMVFSGNFGGNQSVFFSMDAAAGLDFGVYVAAGFPQLRIDESGSAQNTECLIPSFRTIHLVWANGFLWINGLPIGTFGSVPTAWSGKGSIGCYGSQAGNNPDLAVAMRFGFLAFYNTALTGSDISAHFAACQIF